MDKKEEINKHISTVSLHDIDCYDTLQKLSPSVSVFVLSDLKLGGEKRKTARQIVES